jgi:hypothetical protein
LKIDQRVFSGKEVVMPLVIDAVESRKLATAIRKRADDLPPGPEKQQLLSEAREYDGGARSDRWGGSSLQAPE